jgi:hypothetical protein
MSHERHAYFLQDAGLHQARIKGVAKVVETNVADTRVLQRRLPRVLHTADGFVLMGNQEPGILAILDQHLKQPRRERNLPRFPLGSLGAGNKEQAAREVDVLPALARDFAPAHAGVECGYDHRMEVPSCGPE